MRIMSEYFGKYRGKVENNLDPLNLGRLQVSCPSVLGDGSLSWALPSTPYAGDGVGLFLLPPRGANVWIEFEGGNPDYPIWSGCFWGTNEVPASPATENIKMLKTDGVSITIDDMQSAGGLTLVIESPAVEDAIQLICDTEGVVLTIGDAKLTMTTEDLVTAFGEDASIRHSGDGLELAGKESTAVLNDDGIEMVAAESSVTLTDSSIEAANGGANVTLSSDTVTVNDGALEVQ